MTVPPPPPAASLDRVARWLSPLEKAFRVQLEGLEHIPRAPGPLMFVGNHQLLALDSPFLMAEVWRHCRVPLRATVDDFFFWMPPLGHLVERFGAVRASPENADALLEQGQWVLVYPGGAREATKPDGQPYELCWWDRLGFAERALHHRCTIVPVAARGIDSSFRVLLSSDRMMASGPGRLLKRLRVRQDLFAPVVVPRRWPHLRFRICPPIAIDHFLGHSPDTQQRRLRAEVGEAIERGLADMELHHGPDAPQVRGPLGARAVDR